MKPSDASNLESGNVIFYIDDNLETFVKTFAKNNKKILDDINLSMKKGDVVTILGPNGGGKTSLVKVVAGINKNYTGSVIFADDMRISYMPQNFSISSLMPVTVEYLL